MNRVFCAVVLLLGLAALGAGLQAANAEIVMQHQGQTDPASAEGWSYKWGAGVTYEPVVDPVGTTDAFHLASDGNGGQVYLYKVLDSDVLQRANDTGWSYALKLRSLIVGNGPTWGMSAGFDNGVRDYELLFGTDTAGNAQVQLYSGTTYTMPDNNYHTYEFRSAAGVTGTAGFYIDGVLKESGYAGVGTGEPYTLGWGPGTTQGDANFANVTFSIVPEPASGFLVGTGLVGLLAYAWRRRKLWRE